MPNDFYYYLTPVKCFPYLGTGLIDGYNSAYMYGSWGWGGGGGNAY